MPIQVNRLISAATTNATLVRAGPGQILGLIASNSNAAMRYFKLYNKATAPTVGTDIPLFTIGIPGNGAKDIVSLDNFIQGFNLGIGFALTAAAADADTGAVAAGEIVVNVFYK